MLYTIFIFFIVLSILVIIHELGHFTVAKLIGVKVEEFGFGIPPRLFGYTYKGTLYSVNLLPFGGFVRVFGEEEALLKTSLTDEQKRQSFAHKTPLQRSLVLVAGVFLNFMLGWVIISYLFTQGVPVPTRNVYVQSVSPASPAEKAGLRTDDMLTQAVTTSTTKPIQIDSIDDLTTITSQNAGKPVTFTVVRNGKKLEKTLTPRKNPPKGEGALGIGITSYVLKRYSPLQAPYYGLKESAHITFEIGKGLVDSLVRLFTMQKQQGEIAGPIGIAQLTSQAAQQGLNPLLQLIGLLSLNLAVLNILPFPSLDGGRLLFVIIEAVTKKKVPTDFEHKLNLIGFSLLIGLLVLVTVHDIIKLF